MAQLSCLRFVIVVFLDHTHLVFVQIKMPFFTPEQPKRYKLWSCQKMCDALHYLLDNIFIRFCSKSYRQIVGILIDNPYFERMVDQIYILLNFS